MKLPFYANFMEMHVHKNSTHMKKCPNPTTCILTIRTSNRPDARPTCRIVVDLNKDLLPNNANLDFSNETDCLHLGFSVQKGDFLGHFH